MNGKVKIVAFVCENHAFAALRSISEAGESVPESIQLIKLPCTGRLETAHLLDALRLGADGVIIVGCLEENCYHDVGSMLARGRVEKCKAILKDISIEPERIEMINSASVNGKGLLLKLRQFEKRLFDLPKSPLKGGIK